MRLSSFVIDNLELILDEWENFAKTLFVKTQSRVTLRDHAKEMLMAIVLDLQQSQSKTEQTAKSKGLLKSQGTLIGSAAKEHGLAPLGEGFSINDIVSEYRALRASVIKLWGNASKTIDSSNIVDLVRFNEAIDQSVNKSVASYSLYKEKQTRLFETALSSSPDLTCIFDTEGVFLYVNPAMCELFQKSDKEIIGHVFYEFEMYAEIEERQRIQSVLKTKLPNRRDRAYVAPSGKTYFFDSIYTPVFDDNRKIEAIASTSRNITDRKMAEEEIWHTANYDVLTGLPNRRLFLDRLTQEIKHAKREKTFFSLLFIDLVQFKEVNDKLGHDAGDLLLKLTGDRLRACIREIDTLARMGGDEFTIILTNTGNVDQIKMVLNKMQSNIAKPFMIKGKHVNITSSIGVTICPQDGDEPDILLGNADRAMYVAKHAGGNQFTFHNRSADSVVPA